MPMIKSLVSAIVPIYKVESFLAQCLESVLAQTYRPLQLLAIDDGTPDNSSSIAEDFTFAFQEMILVHQANKWLGGARNTGLEMASGEFFSFVDSDDYLALDAYAKTVAFAEKKHCQVVQFGHYLTDEHGHVIRSIIPDLLPSDHVFTASEIHDVVLPILIDSHILNGAPFRLYRSISGMAHRYDGAQFRFRESLRYAEDYVSCLDWFPKYQSYTIYSYPIYYYRTNYDSIMHTFSRERLGQLALLYEIREEFMEKNHLRKHEHLLSSARLLWRLIVSQLLFMIRQSQLSWRDKVSIIRNIGDDWRIREAAHRLSSAHNVRIGKFELLVARLLEDRHDILITLCLTLYSKIC